MERLGKLGVDGYGILNTIQALAADADHTNGILTVTGLSSAIKVAGTKFRKTAFSAGVASVKTFLVSGITLDNTLRYTLKIVCPSVGLEREYLYVPKSGVTLTGDILRDAFHTLIGNDDNALVSSNNGTANTLRYTLLDVANGDFYAYLTAGVAKQSPTVTVVTPYVAPAGTPAVVAELTGAGTGTAVNKIQSAGEYTTYELVQYDNVSNGSVQGEKTSIKRRYFLFLEENATNFAALATAIDAILGGTDTEANYLGATAL